MSKKTNLKCECGGDVRVTPSKGVLKDSTGKKTNEVGKNKRKNMPLPGVGREGDNFWYCVECNNKEHFHLDDKPPWIKQPLRQAI